MLEAGGLSFRYDRRQPWLFQNLDIRITPGEVVGLPGPSGSGKTTLAKLLAGYLKPTQGQIWVEGRPLPLTGPCPVQLLFQHPEMAVNPHWKTGAVLQEGGAVSCDLLEQLEIIPSWLNRYPHELSGGELQRICIARALGPNTRYLLCDETTSMLDALTQARIWRSVLAIAQARGLGLLVISHHKALLEKLCDREVSFLGGLAVSAEEASNLQVLRSRPNHRAQEDPSSA